jgi:hypothetical protein
MKTDPGSDLLVKDQFGVLMTTVTERSHKDVGQAWSSLARVVELAHRAKGLP